MNTEAEALLRLAEQEHRMANVFQLMGSVLTRAATEADDASSAEAFWKADAQLRAFALVQDAVRLSSNHEEAICATAYLRALSLHLHAACLAERGVTLRLEADEPAPLSERTCRILGLIVTELVLNAAKHAFAGRAEGCVTIRLAGQPPAWRVRVEDDGCGLNASPRTSSGRGLRFVEALARGVGARLWPEPSATGACFVCEASA